jgi:hypothetical protein
MIDPYRTIPPIVALAGFGVSIVAGMSAGNPATTIIIRALVAMLCCLLAGEAIAMIVRRIAANEAQTYAARKPIPPLMTLMTTANGDVVEGASGQATGNNTSMKKKA